MRDGSEPSKYSTSSGIRSPKSVLKQSTPWSMRRRRCPWYHATASGFVKSTSPMPACQRSHCHTEPSARMTRKPCDAASSNSGERWPM